MTERVSKYKGIRIEIVYDRGLCIHAAECGRGSRALFDVKKDAWCDPDAVSADEAAAIVARCPTGALRFTRTDGGSPETVPEKNVVTVSPDGPLYVRGNLDLQGDYGEQGVATRIALCRCGQSKNKPFCDNSHQKATFRDSGAVAADCGGVDAGKGVLKIVPLKDGPLLLSGPVTIRAASGRDAFCGTDTALCRCGASANKPFCDGNHARIHFEAD